MGLRKLRLGLSILILTCGSLLACSNQNFDLPQEQVAFGQVVTYNNKVDILLMMDNSSSMQQYQDRFALQVPGMLEKLDQLKLDYHIGVTTSDMRSGGTGGLLVGSPNFVSRSTPNMISILQNRVRVGQSGSDLERGLQSIRELLSPNSLQGSAQGFFRDDALLVLIFLTNEDDYSSGSVSSYVEFFNLLKPPMKGNQPSWIANFIGVVSIDADCRTTADFKEAGLRYMALADASGGRKESICRSSLDQAIGNIRARIVEVMTDFYLNRKPVIETIKVYVNNREVPRDAVNGWSYDPEKNMIRFNGSSVPTSDAQIVVDFKPAEAT